jgi:hypothetical protein
MMFILIIYDWIANFHGRPSLVKGTIFHVGIS